MMKTNMESYRQQKVVVAASHQVLQGPEASPWPHLYLDPLPL